QGRDHLDKKIDGKQVAAPEDEQEIEIVEPRAGCEMPLDCRLRRLGAGETPIAVGSPVAELRERPRQPEGVTLRGTDRRPVRFAIHTDREQVIREIPRWHEWD